MYGSVAELISNQPDFGRMTVPGGTSPYREPVLPGEQRLVPSMQEKLQKSPAPQKLAADRLLDETIAEVSSMMFGA